MLTRGAMLVDAVDAVGPEVLAISADQPASLARDLADSLLAVSDYQAFVTMMRRRASGEHQAEEDDADAGVPSSEAPQHDPPTESRTGGYRDDHR
eukprot:s1620_g25.t1